MSVYKKLVAAGVEIDHHESDLYAKVTAESSEIVKNYGFNKNVRTFKSLVDGELWYDIPFAFDPWWESREAKDDMRNVIATAIKE